MKKKIILIAAFLTLGVVTLLAQGPPDPSSDASESGTYGPVGNGGSGGGAPIGSGTLLLIGLAGLYGSKKVLSIRKTKEE